MFELIILRAMINILLVEDEEKLAKKVKDSFQANGISTTICSSYQELEALLIEKELTFSMMVLDRLLNGIDSANLVSTIKEKNPQIKILILSAINSPIEKASLLNLGADDYLGKPFDFLELTARIYALVRRGQPTLSLGNVYLDIEKRSARTDFKEVILQNREFDLLKIFVSNPRKVFDKENIYKHVWEFSTEVDSNVIETTILKIRKKLIDIDASIKIKSARYRGYWIED